MTNYNITDEQLQTLYQKVSDVMIGETPVQNCTFPLGIIKKGIDEKLSPEEIGSKCYDSIIHCPTHIGPYFSLSAKDTMHNWAMFMSGTVQKELKAFITP